MYKHICTATAKALDHQQYRASEELLRRGVFGLCFFDLDLVSRLVFEDFAVRIHSIMLKLTRIGFEDSCIHGIEIRSSLINPLVNSNPKGMKIESCRTSSLSSRFLKTRSSVTPLPVCVHLINGFNRWQNRLLS